MRSVLAPGLLATLLACGPATPAVTAEAGPASAAEPGPRGGGKCDQVALRAAADATSAMLAAWQPNRGELPDYRRVVRELRAACPGLPPGYHGFLEYGVHPIPDVRSHEMRLGKPLQEDPEGIAPLLRQCPGYRGIVDDVAVRPASERIPTIFEGCNFAELGVFTLAELAANFGDPGGLHGHALYLWLVDDGAPATVARALVRPIVAGTDYALEVATSLVKFPAVARAPAAGWPAPTLYASPEAVTFADRRLVLLTQGNLAASDHNQALIGAVFDAVAEEVDKLNALVERSGRQVSFKLSIAADPALPWATVGKLLWTAGRAGVQSLDVHVLVPDPLRPMATLPLLAVGPAPTIDVEILPGNISLRCGGKTATHDTAALVGAVGDCGGGSLRLAAADDTPWQRVVDVLGALVGHAAITQVVPPGGTT